MTVNDKIETIDNKIEQNKSQYNLDRKTARISAWLPGNVGKYKLFTNNDVLSEKQLLEKAAVIKRFLFSSSDRSMQVFYRLNIGQP